MLASSIPTKIVLPFANNAGGSYINVVPVPSQIGITNGAASFYDGFPPNTFIALAAGGAGPFGKDFNGLLNVISAWERWYCAGAAVAYDATFQTAIGGYPQGAVIMSGITLGLEWLSLVDSNLTDPDTGGAGWVQFTAGVPFTNCLNLTGGASGGSKTASFAADLAVAITSLNGYSFFKTAISLSFNGGTTGANGMDTGALPASGDFAVYSIFNPATNTWASLGTTACNGAVYIGANMPSGYTASALLALLKTNASANILPFSLRGRRVWCPARNVFTNQTVSGWTLQDLNATNPVVPAGATTATGYYGTSSGSVANPGFRAGAVAGTAGPGGTGECYVSYPASDVTTYENYQGAFSFKDVPLLTAHSLYIVAYAQGTSDIRMDITGYEF